ncbi:recombinase family protein [Mesorhizobium sp. M0643]|uniref:recombinase family protein n=1 Tax=Mesorhizobium sp. M0643 TaxID=2956978 RepID=UPI00333A19F7
MDIATDCRQVTRLEIVDTGRRRRWSEGEKLRIVEESYSAPRQASATARRDGISTHCCLPGARRCQDAKRRRCCWSRRQALDRHNDGHQKRGSGIVNNELYIGRLIWNRLCYVKDPSTGRRVSRMNPKADWIVTEVPELRIVYDRLWQAVRVRQIEKLEIRKAELPTLLTYVPKDVPLLLPSASAIYAKKTARLTEALNRLTGRQRLPKHYAR